MSTFALGYLSIDRIVTSGAGTWREQILNGPLTPISSFIPISSHLEIWKHKERKHSFWTSLVSQWLRICLPTQGTWVWSLVQEDSTCCGATTSMGCRYWSLCTRKPVLQNESGHQNEKPEHHRKSSPRSPRLLQLEKARAQQQRPSTAKNK